ncbi:MAG: c-type cytochrome, partial [Lysobacterales bacterium]
LAFSLRKAPDPEANPSQVRLTEERIAPVMAVHVGAEGQAAVAAASAAAPSATDSASGEQTYTTVCMACHAAGVAGAPIPGSDVFKERLAAKGLDGLVASAIAGLNVMPPRGGRPDLSDAEVRATVEFMAQ